MTPIQQLTPAQHAILAKAIHTSGGKIDWFPDHIKGGARKKVLYGLFNRALITTDGTDWFVAAEGYDALGMPRPTPTVTPETVATSQAADPEIEADVRACEATWSQEPQSQDRRHRAREHSKLARILELLHSPAGASIGHIRLVTGWQAHSVRGMLANLKKKNGMTITSTKENGERVYRLTEGV